MKRRHPVVRAGLLAGPTALLVSTATGCSNDSDPPDPAETKAPLPSTIQVSSSVFEDGEPIPPGYSCDGTDSLHRWSGRTSPMTPQRSRW